MIGFVYRWNDSSNGKYYIGSHCGDINDGYIGSGLYFRKAYDKRPEKFSREILYIGKDYDELEQLILETLDAKNDEKSYNLTNNSRGVSKHSEKSKRKISKSLKGRVFSEETREKFSKAKMGSKHPCYGTNGYFKGRKHTEESRLKMSLALRSTIYNEADDVYYESTNEASKILGYSVTHINNMIKGRRKNPHKLKRVKIN